MTHDKSGKLPCRKLVTHYANYFESGYNAFEFVIDFSRQYAENEEAELCTRIVTSPSYVKHFLKLLQHSVEEYEQHFGEIEDE